MYKKIAATILLCATANISYAQETINNKIYCNTTKIIFDTLRREYTEEPFFYGRAVNPENSVMSLWINAGTGTWTVVVSTKEKTCVVIGGADLQMIGGGGANKSF